MQESENEDEAEKAKDSEQKFKNLLDGLGISLPQEKDTDESENEDVSAKLSDEHKQRLVELMVVMKNMIDAASPKTVGDMTSKHVQGISKQIYESIASDRLSEEARSAVLRVVCDITATMVFNKTFSDECEKIHKVVAATIDTGTELARHVKPDTASPEEKYKIYQAFVCIIFNKIMHKYINELTKQSGVIMDACLVPDGVLLAHSLAGQQHVDDCNVEIKALGLDTVIANLTEDN